MSLNTKSCPEAKVVLRTKLLNIFLLFASLLGYLEWGKDKHTFLFVVEKDLLCKLFTDTASVAHPFVLLPLLGQLFLSITIFQKKPSLVLTYIGILSLGLLLVFIFLIGVFSVNIKMIVCSLPFIIISIITIRLRKEMS